MAPAKVEKLHQHLHHLVVDQPEVEKGVLLEALQQKLSEESTAGAKNCSMDGLLKAIPADQGDIHKVGVLEQLFGKIILTRFFLRYSHTIFHVPMMQSEQVNGWLSKSNSKSMPKLKKQKTGLNALQKISAHVT